MSGWSDTLYECKCRGRGVGLTQFSDLGSSRTEEKKEHQIVLIRAYNLVEGDRHLKSRVKRVRHCGTILLMVEWGQKSWRCNFSLGGGWGDEIVEETASH